MFLNVSATTEKSVIETIIYISTITTAFKTQSKSDL